MSGIKRSRNLLLLRALLDAPQTAVKRAAEKARFVESFEILADIEASSPRECARLMAHPLFGAWLAACLKRVSSPDPANLRRPLWVELAYLGAFTMAAALLTGKEAETSVPAYAGMAVIPTIGRLRVGHSPSWDLATIHCLSDGRVRRRCVADRKASTLGQELERLRRVSASYNGLTISLELDDISPYRDCHEFGASGRMPESEVHDWERKLADCWRILAARHRPVAELIAGGLETLVPLRRRGSSGLSVTSRHAPGAIALTSPQDGKTFACTLVHELQHTRLCLLMELVPLRRIATEPVFYSPWRNDPRPLAGLVHGLYACVGVADFWRVECEYGEAVPLAEFEFTRACRQIDMALETLSEVEPHARTELVEAVRDIAADVSHSREPGPWAELAELVALYHAVHWKLQNLKPADSDVELLAERWRMGGLPSRTRHSTISADHVDSLTGSAQLRLAYAMMDEQFAEVAHGDQLTNELEIRHADVQLLNGDFNLAATSYQRAINDSVRSLEGWAGLAVALHAISEPSATVLRLRPELVRAVYERITRDIGASVTPSPARVAAWLASAPTAKS